MRPLILNQPGTDGSQVSQNQDIAAELKSRIDRLKSDFFDMDAGGVDYTALQESDAFVAYKEAAQALHGFNLDTLIDGASTKAFWINIYNALVVHGIVALRIKRSVKEVSRFFAIVSYDIGGQIFSLDAIEHGILRGNRKKHLFSRKPFRDDDQRLSYIVHPLDPRMHFALVCGSNSCPPIDVYEAKSIDEQLNTVSEGFVNSEEVTLNMDRRLLMVSKIFKWYEGDFGGKEGILSFITQYRYDREEKAFLKRFGNRLKIRYRDYDWSLNAA